MKCHIKVNENIIEGAKKVVACINRSLPVSVKTLHLDVCIFETTDPSSILRKPLIVSLLISSSLFKPTETSSAKTVVEFTPRNSTAETTILNHHIHFQI